MATAVGRRVVEMAWENLKPSDVVSAESVDNAVITDMAIGGSTNAIVHLIAMAGRAGVALNLERFDEISRRTPIVANVRPAGKRFLMEDFYNAGGLAALLSQIRELLNLDCMTVTGKTLGQNIEHARVIDEEVIRPLSSPVYPEGGTFVLQGNLAPCGCVVKPVAADPRLFCHTGSAVVFEDYPDLKARINDENLDVTADSVLVLKNAGPQGGPGFPEWGMLPIPNKLLREGVRDMVRISDARMSGTSYGMCILHVAPEAHIGGPLALVRNGDMIHLDVEQRQLELQVDEQELGRRRAAWKPPQAKYSRGYGSLFVNHVTQAHEGCDFDFLHRGEETPEPAIY